MKKATLILMALVAMLSLAACSDSNNPTALTGNADTSADNQVQQTTTVYDMVKSLNADKATLGDFDTLLAGLQSKGLVQPLVRYGNTTVFAPTDEAFAALGLDETNIAELPGLKNILAYHVADGILFASDVLSMDSLAMANGDTAMISVREDGAYIDDSRIDETDIAAPTGVVHVINAVMLPPAE